MRLAFDASNAAWFSSRCGSICGEYLRLYKLLLLDADPVDRGLYAYIGRIADISVFVLDIQSYNTIQFTSRLNQTKSIFSIEIGQKETDE